jgi:hypothetical protein
MNSYLTRLVETTIGNTSRLIRDGVVVWPEARAGVCRILSDLLDANPDCAASIRTQLEPWILAQDALHGEPRLAGGERLDDARR